MPYLDFFGYLPVEESFNLPHGSITPLPEFRTAAEWMERYSSTDGYLYPDMVHTRTSYDGGKTYEKVPKSDRPGLLHRVPATHRLDLPNYPDDREGARYGLAGFLVHMLGFLYGHRCHFYDWWLDGRVSMKGSADYHLPRLQDATLCLETATATWMTWPARQRTVLINALFLKGHTEIYQLEWERFQAEYLVFDAVYAVARDIGRVPRVPHAERIPATCQQLGIPTDQSCVDAIVRLRNDLMHEALWDGRMPGEARGDEAFHSSFWLDRLSRRVALALLGVSGPYVRSAWWTGLRAMLFLDPKP